MKDILFTLCLTVLIFTGSAQQSKMLTLSDVVSYAKSRSPQFKISEARKQINYYRYLSYKSEFRPQLFVFGNVPVYSKEFFEVRQPDGTIKYQSISQNTSSLGFGISQHLPFSGGQISLNTNLARFDDFKEKTKQYNSTPFYISLSQPLFSVNEFKWRKIIEPLKFNESSKEYVSEMENIAQQASELYFDVLSAQSNEQTSEINLKNSKINYEIEKQRVNLGTTTKDKLLQLEIQSLRSEQALAKAKYDFQIAILSLKTFIGLKENVVLQLAVPDKYPILNVSLEMAFEQAKRNRPEFISFERKKQEALRDVAISKAENRQVALMASYGLNNAADQLANAYENPNTQQRLSIGFRMPIVDWGRQKSRYNTAKALQKLTQTTNQFDELAIYQEITTLVRNLELLVANIGLAQKTDSVAQLRYVIGNNLYQIGKLSVSDLNMAQAEKDDARRTYISALREYWNSYYKIRILTLYDFENNIPLTYNK